MAKQVRTLSRIATSIVSWANSVAATRITRDELTALAATLTHEEKRAVDVELVNYYAVKGGAEVGERSKGESIYGPIVAKWQREGTNVIESQRAPAKALSDARSVLFAVEIGEKKGSKTPAIKAATTAQIIQFAVKRAATKDAEPISSAERKEIRHAMLLLSKLIG